MDRIVEAFYRRMDMLPEARTIRAVHLEDLASTKAILKDYLGERLGGPTIYSQKRISACAKTSRKNSINSRIGSATTRTTPNDNNHDKNH